MVRGGQERWPDPPLQPGLTLEVSALLIGQVSLTQGAVSSGRTSSPSPGLGSTSSPKPGSPRDTQAQSDSVALSLWTTPTSHKGTRGLASPTKPGVCPPAHSACSLGANSRPTDGRLACHLGHQRKRRHGSPFLHSQRNARHSTHSLGSGFFMPLVFALFLFF